MNIISIIEKKKNNEVLTEEEIDYFINAIGFNKRDCIEKVRDVVFNSGFFDEIKNKKDIQVIVIENEEDNYE